MTVNLLGIDFEDWYHPELIQKSLTSEKKIPSVINGLDKILNLLEKHETLATFFVVGELLEYKPELIDKIISSGHEIGFHTMTHKKLDSMNPDEFSNELKIFSNLINHKSKGFRAPTFSLNYSSSWAVDVLKKHGYPRTVKPVQIKKGAVVSVGCIIIAGVTVGENSIVGAGSVVASDIPDNCVALGNPARVIKKIE